MLYVGIVGSHKLTTAQTLEAYLRVHEIVMDLLETRNLAPKDVTVVSGGASGVDNFAEQASRKLLMKPAEVYLPKKRRWEPNGFKERNILIAERSDVLHCIRSRDSATYGSGWTADYFDTLGKGEAVRHWV